VDENAAADTLVGITASAADADATNNAITYSLDDSADGRFAIDAGTGVVSVAGALDHETAASHTIVVRAASADGSSSTQTFTVDVNNVNEPADSITLDNTTVDENLAGAPIGQLSATDPEGEPLTFSVSDDRFEIVAGVLKLKNDRSLNWAAGETVTVDVTATDPGMHQATLSLTITVLPNPYAWHYTLRPTDVDHSGATVALDVLLVINEINSPRFSVRGLLPTARPMNDPRAMYFDAQGPDGYVIPSDVLKIINWINDHLAQGEPEADGPSGAASPLSQAPAEPPTHVAVPSSDAWAWSALVMPDHLAFATTVVSNLPPAARDDSSLKVTERRDSGNSGPTPDLTPQTPRPAAQRESALADSLDPWDVESALDDIAEAIARVWAQAG
jgi:hypothetical protein